MNIVITNERMGEFIKCGQLKRK